MSYIIIEKHGGADYSIIANDTDGDNVVFETLEEAEKEAADCQDGVIVVL